MAGWTLSIDFGTSNTAAAHISAISGRIETLPLSHHSNLMSSAVFVESAQTIVTGPAAAAAADRDPSRFVPYPKRLVGVVPTVLMGDEEIRLERLIGAVLAAVLDRARAVHNGEMPATVVLTHPEGWSPQQIAVLTAAAAEAGVDPAAVVTVSEPRAAAHHYTRAAPPEAGTTLAVFDFGGGTVDVAVLTATGDGGFEVAAARGDNTLGGKDFDLRIRRWIEDRLAEDEPEIAEAVRRAPIHVQRSIDEQISAAKELLSETPSATVTIDTGAYRHTMTITRDEFDALITGDVDKAVALTGLVLADARIDDPGGETVLYLTGGSARVPLVHARLAELATIATLDDPKTVVAQGALLTGRDLPGTGGYYTVPLHRHPEGPQRSAQTNSPHPPVAASVNSSTGGRKGLAVAAVLGVLAAAGGLAVFLSSQSTDDTAVAVVPTAASTVAASSGTASTSTDSSDEETYLEKTDPRKVVAQLPQPLADDVEDCITTGVGTDGSVGVICKIALTSRLVTDRVREGGHRVSVNVTVVDEAVAMQKILLWRGTSVTDDLQENDARTAALNLVGMDPDPGMYLTQVANAQQGLLLDIVNLRDTAAAEAFVRESGLFD